MTVTQCPNCEAQVLPGDVSCRRCKYDFIMGRQLTGSPESEARRRQLAVAGTLGGVLLAIGGIIAASVLVNSTSDVVPVDNHPCMALLQSVQPRVLAAHTRGNPLPICKATPPGPVDCWVEADVGTSLLQVPEGLQLWLDPTRAGFEIRCRSDLDGDGDRALYEANDRVTAVRITALGVL